MKLKKVFSYLLSMVIAVSTVQVSTFGYEGKPLGENVAMSKVVRLSNNTKTDDNNKPEYLTDGNLSTRYQAGRGAADTVLDPQTWYIDLGKVYTIDNVTLYWESAAAKVYDIYVSQTNKDDSWTLVSSETNGGEGKYKHTFNAVDARYVKLELKERVYQDYGYCLYEFQVFTVGSVDEKETTNLAKAATATASDDDGNNVASNVNDGNYGTMWRTKYFEGDDRTEAEKAAENITLEWTGAQTFDVIKVRWNGGYMKEYKFQTSTDGVNWEDLYTVTNGKANETRKIKLNQSVTSSYLRLQGVTFGQYCFEVKEIEVYDETNIAVDKINLNYTKLKLDIDGENSVQIKYNTNPSNASNKSLTWTSSNNNIATVKDGLVTGVSVGRATITATSDSDPNVKATCEVCVAKQLEKSVITVNRVNKSAHISWTKVNHAGSYIVIRTNQNRAVESVVYQGTGLSCADENIEPGRYYYQVIAVVDSTDANADLYNDSTSEESAEVIIPVDVEGIEIPEDKQYISLFVGETGTVKYSVLPYIATNKNVSFRSANEKVATVDKDGIVTAIGAGTTEVTVTTEEGGFSAKVRIIVDNIEITSMDKVGKSTIDLEVGSTNQFEVDIKPDNATIKTVDWSSSNTSIATVDQNGKVTAMAPGRAIIKAISTNGFVVEYTVNVKLSAKQITLNKSNITVYIGKTQTLQAAVYPSNSSEKKLKWVSSNDTVATVDGNGNVRGILEGIVYISAMTYDEKVVATCMVTVIREPVTPPTKVKVTSLKKRGLKVTLKWKKATDAVGYVIYMKTNNKAYKKVKTITKSKTVKYIKKLKRGNTYRFKIRAYKLDDGDKVYSPYSKVKKIKL